MLAVRGGRVVDADGQQAAAGEAVSVVAVGDDAPGEADGAPSARCPSPVPGPVDAHVRPYVDGRPTPSTLKVSTLPASTPPVWTLPDGSAPECASPGAASAHEERAAGVPNAPGLPGPGVVGRIAPSYPAGADVQSRHSPADATPRRHPDRAVADATDAT